MERPWKRNARNTVVNRLSLIAVLGAVATVSVLWLFASGLRTQAHWQDHADTLIIEMIARDLVGGGRLLDWRMTQAPYLFPDVALAIALAPFAELGGIGRLVHFSLLFLGAASWTLLARKLGRPRLDAALAGALFSMLFGLSFFHQELDSVLALYLGLPGHHSSMSATFPLAVICLLLSYEALERLGAGIVRSAGARERDVLRLAVCWLVLTALAVSDGLFSVSLLGPALLLFGCSAISRWKTGRAESFPGALYSLLLASILVATEGFHRALPFPQKNEFFKFMLERVKIDFPAFPLSSARGIALAPFESPASTALFAAAAGGVVLVLLGLRRDASSDAGSSPGVRTAERTILWSFLLGTALIPAAQIALGMWTGIDSSRQLAWAVIAWIMLGAIYLTPGRPQTRRGVLTITTVAMTLCLLQLALATGRPVYDSRFRAVANCLERARPNGFHFVGDFWDVLPITLHSNGKFSGLAFADTLESPAAFSNGQKVSRLRTLIPTVAAVKPGPEADRYLATFGAPAAVIRCDGKLLEFWDYRNSEIFLRRYADAAKKAY